MRTFKLLIILFFAINCCTAQSNTIVQTTAPGGSNTIAGSISVQGMSISSPVGGGNNIAIGNRSLVSGAGTINVAVGSSALNLNTANFNTAVGDFTLAKKISGDDNSAFGAYALNANTNDTGNSAFGRNALALGTTGSSNCAHFT
ncbi:hypothetical protein [Ferruginibacter albus]|uniref:hypothetical protein n=1 Tax=Ferruginibacter albus TaxID=2875540 RepID=UPI001CC59CB6|nr:hypothetical protein [Ferruginibacter albus]UAY53265.1 hypothetical protein K9M53_06230 [Ferruginibacter albus]